VIDSLSLSLFFFFRFFIAFAPSILGETIENGNEKQNKKCGKKR